MLLRLLLLAALVGLLITTAGDAQVRQSGDSGALTLVNCVSGCSGGTTDTDDGSVAGGQSTGLSIALQYLWTGAAWVRGTGDATNGADVDVTRLPDEGQQTMANSVSVAIASNQSAVSVSPQAISTGGGTTSSYISVGTTEDEHAICTAACTLYSIGVTNTNAAVRYLKCENDTAANTAPGTDTPEFRMAVPGATTGGGFTHTFPVGAAFGTALTCWLVTGAADSDVAEVAANELMVFYTYKQ